MPPSTSWGLSASTSQTLRAGAGAAPSARAILRRSFVMSAVTRSPLPRRLFPSELLSNNNTNKIHTQTRFSSSAAATASKSTPPPSLAEADDASSPDPALAFQTLAPHIHPNTLKAITVSPFKYTHMSSVQAQILPLLPYLAQPYDADSSSSSPSSGKANAKEKSLPPHLAPPPHSQQDEALSTIDGERPRDLLVKAKTGTGKTMAFLVPAIESRIASLSLHASNLQTLSSAPLSTHDILSAQTSFAKTHLGALIISPTRELATQIAVEAQNLTAHHRGFQVQVLLGGESKGRQMRNWRGGRKDIVVATPGRLLDLINTEPEVLDAVRSTRMLILDEADTLLDMGFREDITRLTTYLPPSPQRQTFLFSATVSRQIQQIAESTLSPNHRYVNCVSADDSPVHAHIPQYHTVLKGGEELLPHLLRLLAMDQLEHQHGKKSKVILFLSTTNSVILFSQLLRKARGALPAGMKTSVYEMHAKREMRTRTRVSDSFRSDTSPSILVTSDVSARGVDYPGVTRVIQVGVPSGADIYVHRVGRTGRGSNREGRGDLVLMPWEMGFVRGKLRGVPLLPVTAANISEQLASLAEESTSDSKYKYDRARVSEIPSLAAELTHQLSQYNPADVQGAFSSQLGFFIGRVKDQGLDIQEVARGLAQTWKETWGLEREPVVSRTLGEMMRSGGSQGYGRGRDRGGYGGAGRRDDRGGRDIGTGWNGFSRDRDGNSGRSSQTSANPYSVSGTYTSRQGDGYGYAKGSRQGLGAAKRWGQTRESEWESGGAGAWGARDRDATGRSGYLRQNKDRGGGYGSGRGDREGGGQGRSREAGGRYNWREEID